MSDVVQVGHRRILGGAWRRNLAKNVQGYFGCGMTAEFPEGSFIFVAKDQATLTALYKRFTGIDCDPDLTYSVCVTGASDARAATWKDREPKAAPGDP